jgi:hypothetical protein
VVFLLVIFLFISGFWFMYNFTSALCGASMVTFGKVVTTWHGRMSTKMLGTRKEHDEKVQTGCRFQ